MNISIFNFVMAIESIWKFGAHIGWKFLMVLLLLLSTGQLLWQFWRWVDDAKEREESSANDGEHVKVSKRRYILYGNLFSGRPWEVSKHELSVWWWVVIVVSGIIAGIGIALWPIVITAAVVYGIGQLARGSRRTQKTVAGTLKALKDKSDKGHDHKGKYQEVK